MKSIKPATVIRTVVLALALLNQVLSTVGTWPVGWEDSALGKVCTITCTTSAVLWSWWKNNSFTQAALTADEIMKQIKEDGSAEQ